MWENTTGYCIFLSDISSMGLFESTFPSDSVDYKVRKRLVRKTQQTCAFHLYDTLNYKLVLSNKVTYKYRNKIEWK